MLVEMAINEGVIWYISQLMKRICNERLKTLKGNFVVHNENKPLLALMFLPTMKEIPVTRNAQKPHLVNPILMKRNTLTREGERVHLGGG